MNKKLNKIEQINNIEDLKKIHFGEDFVCNKLNLIRGVYSFRFLSTSYIFRFFFDFLDTFFFLKPLIFGDLALSCPLEGKIACDLLITFFLS